MAQPKARELLYVDFLEDPTRAYYPLDCAGIVVLVEGDKRLGLIITEFALNRLSYFWRDYNKEIEIVEIDIEDLNIDPSIVVKTLESGKYVHIVGDSTREDEMCAAPMSDLDYILLC